MTVPPVTQIASHRGGAALWPENSERAFRETLKLGVEQIEFDVQLSADGVPVIFHDATVDRVTDGEGSLGAKTLAELKALSIFRDGGSIMTLAEGAAILAESEIVLRCEIKPGVNLQPYEGLVGKTVAELARLGLIGRTVFTSFHLPTVCELRDKAPDALDLIWLVAVPIARLTSPQQLARLARSESVSAVSLHHDTLDDGTLEALRGHGLRVGAFAVLEDETISKVLQQRVSVFTTDRPDAALRLRQGK